MSEGGGYSGDRTEVREWAGVRRVGHVRHVRRVSGGMQVVTKKGGAARAAHVLTLQWSMKFSVAPLSTSARSSALPLLLRNVK